MTKICTKCQREKELIQFKPDSRLKSGYGSQCLDCHKVYSIQYNVKHNRSLKQAKKRNYLENRERYLAQKKQYRLDNSQKLKIKASAYYESNKDKIIKRVSCWQKNRRASDPQFRIARNLRKRVWEALRSQSAIKKDKTIKLVGCSVKQLMCHLESLFEINMSWSNYGDWHVDHKKPCSSYDLTNPQPQQDCFHYTNLQPLWARDNLSKNNSLNWQKPCCNTVQ